MLTWALLGVHPLGRNEGGSPIGLVQPDRPALVVHEVVMERADQAAVVDVGGTTIGEMAHVVDVAEPEVGRAAGESAASVSSGDGPAQPAGPHLLLSTDREWATTGVDDDRCHDGVAQDRGDLRRRGGCPVGPLTLR